MNTQTVEFKAPVLIAEVEIARRNYVRTSETQLKNSSLACPECDRRFRTTYSLRHHMKMVHKDAVSLKNDRLRARFWYLKSLRTLVEYHAEIDYGVEMSFIGPMGTYDHNILKQGLDQVVWEDTVAITEWEMINQYIEDNDLWDDIDHTNAQVGSRVLSLDRDGAGLDSGDRPVLD